MSSPSKAAGYARSTASWEYFQMKNRILRYLLPVLCLALQNASGHMTDRVMIRDFQAHRVEFTNLLAMFRADKSLLFFANGHLRPEDPQSAGVTTERLKEYEVIFFKLGLQGIGSVC